MLAGVRLGIGVRVLVAVIILVEGLSASGASTSAESVTGILVWWALLVTLALGLAPLSPMPRRALITLGALVAFAALTGLSAAWAPSAGQTFEALNRLSLYAAILALPIALARPGQAAWWCDGIALGMVAISAAAFGQRLLPDLLPRYDLTAVLPDAGSRLSYPLGYWNGLGIFVALGLPLLLRSAVTGRTRLARGLAVAAVPVLVSTIYLTSSRGAVAVGVVGVGLFVVLCGQGIRALLAALVGVLGGLAAVVAVHAHRVLVQGPFSSPAATSAGHTAAPLVLACCAIAGASWGIAGGAPGGLRLTPRGRGRLALGTVVLLAVSLLAVDLPARIRAFTAPPHGDGAGVTAIGAHLGSGNGSGRWQFWSAALDEFGRHPLLGGGAGSYESWWAQHGSLDWFVRNAHSLWLETLAELGIVGLALIFASFAVPLLTGVRALPARDPDARPTPAALVALLAAFVVGAALDWVWQLPVVAAVALIAAGLLVGPAEGTPSSEPGPRSAGTPIALRVLLAAACLVAVACESVQFLAEQQLAASRHAVSTDRLVTAVAHARSAQRIEPWASAPRIQLALSLERQGSIGAARRAIAGAIRRDSSDWQAQVIAARLAVKAGAIGDGRDALRRARELNPRSTLLNGPTSGAAPTTP